MNEERATGKLVSTHGVASIYTGKDGVKRELDLFRFCDGTLQFRFKTYWDGDEKDPLETAVRLKPESFSVMLSILSEFALNMDKYEIPAESEE